MSSPRPLLLVVNQGDASVSVVDPAAQKVIANIRENVPAMVGHEVAVSPDGRTAFLPLYGDAGVGRPGNDGDSLLLLDLDKYAVSRRVSFGSGVRPHCPMFDPNTGMLYVTTELLDAVSVIDTHSMELRARVPTGAEQSHMLAISHDGKRGYTANVSTGTVSVLDLPGRSLVKKLQIAPSVQRIAISPDDRTIVTSDQTEPRMAFLNTSTLETERWIKLPSLGYGAAFSPDGKTLLVTLPQAGQLAVVDLATHTVSKVIDIGPRPQEVIVRPDGRVAFVSCFGSNFVAVVDLATALVTGKIETGQKADGMAWVR